MNYTILTKHKQNYYTQLEKIDEYDQELKQFRDYTEEHHFLVTNNINDNKELTFGFANDVAEKYSEFKNGWDYVKFENGKNGFVTYDDNNGKESYLESINVNAEDLHNIINTKITLHNPKFTGYRDFLFRLIDEALKDLGGLTIDYLKEQINDYSIYDEDVQKTLIKEFCDINEENLDYAREMAQNDIYTIINEYLKTL